MRKFILVGLFVILASVVFAANRPAGAQASTNTPVVLDDSTPSVDVQITPTGGAPGVINLELEGVHAHLRDSANVDILLLGDKRVTGLAFQIVQGAAPLTLHLERLPGVAAARVLIIPQAAMPDVIAGPAQPNGAAPVAMRDAPVSTMLAAPAVAMPFTVTDNTNMVGLQLSPDAAMTQLVDDHGTVLMSSVTGPAINGLALRLLPGQYTLNVVNRDVNTKSTIGFALSAGPVMQMASTPASPGTADQTVANSGVTCSATVAIASVNLRSGPGTAYSALGYARRGTVLLAGGINNEKNWLLVQSPVGSAWVARMNLMTAGNCDHLTIFNIPLRNAAPAPVVEVTVPAPVMDVAAAPSRGPVRSGEHESGGDRGDDD